MRTWITAAIFIILFCLLNASAGDSSRALGEEGFLPVLEERNEALIRQADLGEREKELAAELLTWDVKLESARREQERLQQEIPVVKRSVAEAGAGLEESRARMDAGLERLGRWVNFLYRSGPVTYLEVILGATDFYDFVARAEAVRIIIAGQLELLDEVSGLVNQFREQVLTLEKLQKELEFKSLDLDREMKQIQDFRAGREAFLAGLRLESAELAGRIVQVETFLYRSLNSLHYLLSNLDALPWYALNPEGYSLKGKTLRLEFSDRQVNQLFLEQGDGRLAGLSVSCSPGLFTIYGKASANGADFSMGGNFVPAEPGQVRFKPERMSLAGIPIGPELLGFITSEQALTINLVYTLPGYSLTEVRAEEGKLVICLTAF